MYKTMVVLFTLSLVFSLHAYADSDWIVHTINAESDFEAAGVGDFNGDNVLDVVSGNHWYEGPNWEKHKIADMQPQNEYYNDFASKVMDVDNDGDDDVVSCAWFSKQFYWRDNPGSENGLWPVVVIDEPGNMETGFFVDMNQDGLQDFVPNLSPEVVWYEKVANKPEWKKHVVGKEGKGHGLGVGDVNQDGVIDIVTLHGWYQGSQNGNALEWQWHPEFETGSASVPMLVMDANGDGENDIVYGMAHDYGVYALLQHTNDQQRNWEKITIDKSWSQAHYLFVLDLDGDGKEEIVTGKRYRAHNGKDPGSTDPLGIFSYQYNKKKKEWQKTVIHLSDKVGFGLNPEIADLDQDGDLDLICAGKSGLYWLEQK